MSFKSRINAAELLGRALDPVYTKTAMHYFKNKTILVTGAGGSIGSEIVNQLIELGAKKIVCVDRDEYALYNLDLNLNGSALLTDDTLVLADIRDYMVVDNIVKQWKPEIIFHAAAVKHLPLLERSPTAAFITNIIGTKNVIEAAINNGVEKFVNISTDKAADPTSVLGYSKRIAEMIASYHSTSNVMIASVRFGNVFASRGSFIETLQWQVLNEKDVTITDADATRFFMSIPQAAGLVIETSLIAKSGNTYVLDMDDPVKIVDVVNRYVEMVGADNTKIIFSGLRQGEKLHEILYDRREENSTTQHKKISTVRVPGGDEDFMLNLMQFSDEVMQNQNLSTEYIISKLKDLSSAKPTQVVNALKLTTMEVN
jgi:FlaA1/EpsC-like NDP-sugar epimerase